MSTGVDQNRDMIDRGWCAQYLVHGVCKVGGMERSGVDWDADGERWRSRCEGVEKAGVATMQRRYRQSSLRRR